MSVLSGKALKEIVKELIYLQQTPPEDIQVIPNDEDLTTIEAWIRGPGKKRKKKSTEKY